MSKNSMKLEALNTNSKVSGWQKLDRCLYAKPDWRGAGKH